MAYTRVWDETRPDGAVVLADQIDDEMEFIRVDLRERIAGIFGLSAAEFAADPIVPQNLTVSEYLSINTAIGGTPYIDFAINGTVEGLIGTSAAGGIITGQNNTFDIRGNGRVNFATALGTLTAYMTGKVTQFIGDFGPAATFNGALTGTDIEFDFNSGNQGYYPIAVAANGTITIKAGSVLDGHGYRMQITDPNSKTLSINNYVGSDAVSRAVEWYGTPMPATALTAGKAILIAFHVVGQVVWATYLPVL